MTCQRCGKEVTGAHTCKPMSGLEEAQQASREKLNLQHYTCEDNYYDCPANDIIQEVDGTKAQGICNCGLDDKLKALDQIVKDTWEAAQRDLIDQGFSLNENAFYE